MDLPRPDETADLKPFTGQHAAVTGGGRGIGAAIAEHLAARGASLTLLGRTKEPLEAMKARLRERYGRDTLEEVFLDVARGRGENREAAQ